MVLKDNLRKNILQSLKKLQLNLPEYLFERINNKYLINMDHLRLYYSKHGYSFSLSNGELIPVARNRKKHFLKKISEIAQ